MNYSTLKEIRDKNPFQPFTMHVSDGRNAHIPHPDFLAFSPDKHTVIAFTQEGGARLLDITQITELDMSRPGRRKPAN